MPYAIDRVKRGSIPLTACCISVLGGLQPQKVSTYLVGSLGKPVNNDGLVQRLQLLVYPDFPGDYDYVDRLPDSEAADRVDLIYRELACGNPENPTVLHFSPAAQERFVAWHVPFERMVRAGKFPDVMTAHFAKYKSLVPSLALLFELTDSVLNSRNPESVTDEQTERAIRWPQYLASHAQRIYAPLLEIHLERAIALANKLKSGQLSAPFSARDAYNNWELLNNANATHEAAAYLVEAGWLREQRVPSTDIGGRPAIVYHANPKIRFEDHLRV